MKTKILAILTVWLLALTSCTQNGGHIGTLFGSWSMTEMTVDGTPRAFPDQDYTTVSFQGTVAEFEYHKGLHMPFGRYATWVKVDDILRFDFTHHDDDNPAGTGKYEAPSWLDLPSNCVIDMTIAKLDSGHMTWVYRTTGGVVIIYKFERTW